MQVGDPRSNLVFDHRLDRAGPLGIGIGIQQHQAAVADEPIRPGANHEGADQTAHGIQELQAEEIATGQRDNRQHGGARIRQHMHIGGAHIVVHGRRVRMILAVIMAMLVVMLIVMPIFMSVVMAMIGSRRRMIMPVGMAMGMSVVIVLQDQGADQIDAKPDRRDQQRVAILHGGGRDQAFDRLHRHHQRGHPQNDGAGKSRQVAEFARAESKAAVCGIAAGQPIGPGRQAKRPDMGGHMHAIGQERHGVIGKAAADLDHHEDGGHQRRQLGLAFRAAMACAQENMILGPHAMVVGGVVCVVVGHGPDHRTIRAVMHVTISESPNSAAGRAR